ncbi:unnamed protein product [Amaranthus hypochondriacus]
MRLSSFHLLQFLFVRFNSTTNFPCLSKIPTKYRAQAVQQAQEVIIDYLHSTRALPFTYAEFISKNSIYSLSELISKVHYSSTDFRKTLLKFVRYNPINEFGFFYESIGIDYANISGFLKPNLHFLSDDSTVLDVACTLAGFGFPWNRLGKLYVEEVSIFEKNSEFLGKKFDGLLNMGFGKEQVIGICLAFPVLLKREEAGPGVESDKLLSDLKRVFIDFDLKNYLMGNVDVWYEVCRKIKVFYDLGVEKGIVAGIDGKSKSIFIDYNDRVLAEKVEFFCKLGIQRADVGVLLLENSEILSIELGNQVISVSGFLEHFGLHKKELRPLLQKFPYIFGRNKMSNLPHILRAMDLQEWFFGRLKLGDHKLLATYGLSSSDEGEDTKYVQNLETIICSRTHSYSLSKLEFFHGIGFGENDFVMKLLFDVHGSPSDLQERFDFLLNEGILFSKLCKMIVQAPKFLNQDLDNLKRKIDFLHHELGLSFEFLETFPAYFVYNLEKRVRPRYRFHVWLTKQGWVTKKYSISGIIAISHKGFLTQLAKIHPTAPQLWLEQCRQKEKNSESNENAS